MSRWSGRRRGEDGVIAVFVAVVTCFTIVPLAAYTVDIGVQRVATRDMQALADVVALDLSRQLDGRTFSQLNPLLQGLADTSAARNGGVGDDREVRAELGIVDESKYTVADPDAIFTPVTSDADGVPNAVRVTASTAVDFSIHGGAGGAARTAIGRTRAAACFSIGSYALNLTSEKSALLNALIGDALNLSALSYTGLANAKVSLLGLATEMGLGGVGELLELKNLSLNQLYLASAKALAKEGGTTAELALLNQLAAASFSGLGHFDFNDLISMDAGSGAALATKLNVFDLVAGSAFLANGTNALAVPSVTAGVPNVGTVTASLHVIQAPIMKCGAVGTSVSTSQVSLDLTASLLNVNLLSLLTSSSTIVTKVRMASATGTLTKIVCGSAAGIDVAVASSLAELSTDLTTTLKTLLGITVARVDGHAGTVGSAATSTVQIRIPPNSYGQPVSSGSGVVLPQMALALSDVHVLGILPFGVSQLGILNAVTSSIVTPTVNPLTANLNTKVVGPLAKAVGLELGGADVFVVQQPTCDQVTLLG